MSPAVKTVLRCVVAFVAAGLLCVAALFVSGLASPERIMNTIRKDYTAIEARGDYPIIVGRTGTPKYRYDGFTDGIMMLQSIPDRERSLLDNAVLGPYYAFGDGTGGDTPTGALLQKLNDPSIAQDRTYVLYWHGYVVPLRAAFSLGITPMTLIVINCIVFVLLMAMVFEVFRRTGGLSYGISFLLALVATFAWITPAGFQFFTSFLLAFLATLVLYWLLQKPARRTWIVPSFLIMGLLTAFFDFLTTPLLTFLLPLTLLILWAAKRGKAVPFKSTVSVAGAWLAGYAGFWASKWLLTAAVYGAEYANTQFGHALAMRSGTDTGGGLGYRFNAIYNNLYQLFALHPDGSIHPGPFFAIAAGVILVLAAIWWVLVKKTAAPPVQIKAALPLLLVVAGPYVWYFVMAQHSTFHSWMTWRLQTASIVGLLFFFLLSIDWSALIKSKRRV
ncbi:MAG: hypothetical protein FWE46_01555 [Coriobacteriia bacterium]|nr:hypothetical protein [Coriobacteriia bacterium]MCL2536880.1 hypothetical protein [Coriobacteriia bacterium]